MLTTMTLLKNLYNP